MTISQAADQLGCTDFHQGINRGWARFKTPEAAYNFHRLMWEKVEEWRDIPQRYIEGELSVHWR